MSENYLFAFLAARLGDAAVGGITRLKIIF